MVKLLSRILLKKGVDQKCMTRTNYTELESNTELFPQLCRADVVSMELCENTFAKCGRAGQSHCFTEKTQTKGLFVFDNFILFSFNSALVAIVSRSCRRKLAAEIAR